MPVARGRSCNEAPLERGNRQGRPESMDLFVLVLCHRIVPFVQKWCEQGLRADIDSKPLAAWAYADVLFLVAG